MKITVLDKGYVELIEAWGHGKDGIPQDEWDGTRPDFEVGIIESARQSTQGSFRGWGEDKKLLRTLYHHQANQSTPFEAAGMTIEVEAPIFVFREWHRHRTQSYNEASARYIPLPDTYYLPDFNVVMERAKQAAGTKNKQAGSSGGRADDYQVEAWRNDVKEFYQVAENLYQHGLNLGIPKELARIVMPVGHYSRMRATANLRNWLGFLQLRLAPNAQWEIRKYAMAVANIVQKTFPHTAELFFEDHEEV
jgi:thymidylate synthase (FAD)